MSVGYELDGGSWIFRIGVEKNVPISTLPPPPHSRFNTGCCVYQTLYARGTRTDSSAEGEAAVMQI